MTTSQHPRPGFEERLLSELKQVVAERATLSSSPVAGKKVTSPVRRLGWKPRLALAAAVTMLAVTAVVVAPGLGENGSAAYAVTAQQDGTVRVEIHHLSDADGLKRELEEAGIPAEVDYAGEGMYCNDVPPRFTPVPGDQHDLIGFEGERDGSIAFTLDPADFEGDRTLVIETRGPREGTADEESEVMAIVATGAVRPCEPVEDTGHTERINVEPGGSNAHVADPH